MNTPLPTQVTYRATDMVIAVRCTDETQVTAVQKFAADNNFPCPPRTDDRPVYPPAPQGSTHSGRPRSGLEAKPPGLAGGVAALHAAGVH